MKKGLVAVICVLTITCGFLGYGWYKTSQKLELTQTLLDCSMALHDIDNDIAQLAATVDNADE